MIIVYDQREQRPYVFGPADYTDVKTEPGTLYDDLTGTLTAGRDCFTRECERGRGLDYFGLVIEASMEDVRKHKYRSKLPPHSLFQSLVAFSVRYNLHIHWCGSREGGEYTTYSLLQKYLREATELLKTITRAHQEAP